MSNDTEKQTADGARLSVRKTYKLYINGEFPRTESGRFYEIRDGKGESVIANACRGSRKDVRNAVVAARKAFSGWSGKTAYNRGQILYRIAEVCESRAPELVNELTRAGVDHADAEREVHQSIDRWVYYAGWCDKYMQVYGSVNPVAGPYYNFSVLEPTGVVGIVSPEAPHLLGFVSRLAPVLAGGNTAVILPSERNPLPAVTLGEIFSTSDVPGGVINIVSGFKRELVPWLASHMDLNAIDCAGVDETLMVKVQESAAENVKRVVAATDVDWYDQRLAQSPYAIFDFMEVKTVWHPMGM